jgi:hypothetical protein
MDGSSACWRSSLITAFDMRRMRSRVFGDSRGRVDPPSRMPR